MSRQKIFNSDPLEQIPKKIVDKVGPHLGEIEEVMRWMEDKPHQKFHILNGIYIIRNLSKKFGEIGTIEADLAERSFRLHDSGYRFSDKGYIKHTEHHFASVLIANQIDTDVRVLRAILYHVEDILPVGTPMWARLVRDTDRLLMMGYIGIIRQAMYLGFDSEYLTSRKPDEVVRDGILCDFKDPTDESYEIKAKVFCLEHVFPYLYEKKLIKEMTKEIMVWEKRFKGITKDGTWGNSIPPERDIDLYGGWEIEPINHKVRSFYTDRLWHSYEALGYLRESDPRKWVESARWCRNLYHTDFE